MNLYSPNPCCSSSCFLAGSTLTLLGVLVCGLLRLVSAGSTLLAGVELWVSICSLCFFIPCDLCPHTAQMYQEPLRSGSTDKSDACGGSTVGLGGSTGGLGGSTGSLGGSAGSLGGSAGGLGAVGRGEGGIVVSRKVSTVLSPGRMVDACGSCK